VRSRSNWNLKVLVFKERGKPEYPEKNLLEQGREPTTNSTHIWRQRQDSNPGHIGGRQVLSPLRHPCSPCSPCCHFYKVNSGLSEPIQWYLNFTLIVSATDGDKLLCVVKKWQIFLRNVLRVTPGQPSFSHVGINYIGPFMVKQVK